MAVIYLAAGNVLPLTDRADPARPANLKPQTIDDFFQIWQDLSISIRPIHITINQQLSFDQSTNYNPKKLSVGNSLGLTQATDKVPQQFLHDYLGFSQSVRTVLHEIVVDVLSLSQSIGMTRGLANILILVDVVDYKLSSGFQLTDILEFVQGVAVRKENNPDFVADPPAPVVVPQNVTYAVGALSITLPPPEFGDEDKIQHQRINRRTRAGELIVYKDPLWPIIETLTFRFTGLSDVQAKATLLFLNNTIGQLITMVDYRGVTWTGVITNPDADTEQEGGHVCPSFNIDIDFEGSRI